MTLPYFMTTHIGSLPFDSVEKAVEFSLRFDIPAMPELPQDGIMLDYLKNPGRLAALDAFKRGIKKGIERNECKVVKIQSPGPVTAFVHGRYLKRDAVSRVREHIQKLAEGLDGVEELYIFLDEPALREVHPGFTELWDEVYDKLKLPEGVAVREGVHLCNDPRSIWNNLFYSRMKVVSFNPTRYDLPLNEEAIKESYGRYRKMHGKICWGVVDVRPDIGTVILEKPENFVYGDLLSPACGLRLCSPDLCERVYKHLTDCSRRTLNH